MRVHYAIVSVFALATCMSPALAEPPTGSESGSSHSAPSTASDSAIDNTYIEMLAVRRGAVRREPTSAVAHHELGLALLATNQINEAIEHCSEAVRLDPDQHTFRQSLAVCFLKANRVNDAILQCDEVVDRASNRTDACIEIGKFCIQWRLYRVAVRFLDTALAKGENRSARYLRIIALYRSDCNREAVTDCDIILRESPGDHRALAYRAYANLRLTEYDAAEDDAKRALAAGDDFAGIAHLVLGAIYCSRKNIDLAVQHLDQAVVLERHPLAYVFRAAAHWQRLDLQSTLSDLTAAVTIVGVPANLNFALDGHGWYVFKSRGIVKILTQWDFDGAIADFSEAINLHSNDSQTYALRGWTYSLMKDWKRSLDDLNAALRLDPDNQLALYGLGNVYVSCPERSIRNGTMALNLAKRLDALSGGKSPAGQQILAAAYSENGDFAAAANLQSKLVNQAREGKSVDSYDLAVGWGITYRLGLAINSESAERVLESYRNRINYSEHLQANSSADAKVATVMISNRPPANDTGALDKAERAPDP